MLFRWKSKCFYEIDKSRRHLQHVIDCYEYTFSVWFIRCVKYTKSVDNALNLLELFHLNRKRKRINPFPSEFFSSLLIQCRNIQGKLKCKFARHRKQIHKYGASARCSYIALDRWLCMCSRDYISCRSIWYSKFDKYNISSLYLWELLNFEDIFYFLKS